MDGVRNRRSKKVSGKLGVVTDDDKQHAIKARLDALENDDNVKEDPAAGSDEEYVLEESDEGDDCARISHRPALPDTRCRG